MQSTKVEDSGPPTQAYYKKLPCTVHGSVELKHIASTSKCTKRSPKAPPGYWRGVYKEETCRFKRLGRDSGLISLITYAMSDRLNTLKEYYILQ